MTTLRALLITLFSVVALARGAQAQLLNEGFDDLSALPAAGWVNVNTSVIPITPWFQGNPDVFPSQSGAPRSYVAANFLASQVADVRNWLITPVMPLSGGEVLTFHTRVEMPAALGFADGLSVQLGVGPSASPASFSIGLIEFGPVLGGPYPTDWQLYTIVIPHVAGMTSGRIAFVDFAEDADLTSYIGIDSVRVVSGLPDVDGDGAPDASDNCPSIANADQADADSDAVGSVCDNCTARANPRVAAGFVGTNPWATLTGGQRDDDHDGYGNKCDAKFPGVAGTIVSSGDLAQFRASNGKNRTTDVCGTLATRPCAIFDLDENAVVVGTADLVQFRLLNGKTPGPKCATCPLTCSAGTSGSCN